MNAASANATSRREPTHYRSIFISDVHLGVPGCSAIYLLDFLRATTCDHLWNFCISPRSDQQVS
jgi:hypothetical protein